MAIGDGWREGSWVDASWTVGAWLSTAVSKVSTVINRLHITIGRGIRH